MYQSETEIRIHYALTDQMGVVYYGNYAQFFEIGRTEAIRKLGFAYKSLEEMGIIMPVSQMTMHFKKPIYYDELITVRILIKDWPKGVKIAFSGEIYNEQGELCTTSTITLFFVDAKTRKPVPIPERLSEVLRPYYNVV